MPTVKLSQVEFYKEYLMGRESFTPREYGVDMDRSVFDDLMVDEFHGLCRNWTIDELVLHPREALNFCDGVRRKHGYYDLPDHIILRVINGEFRVPTAF